jgi:PAS domain S-box-containing protein
MTDDKKKVFHPRKRLLRYKMPKTRYYITPAASVLIIYDILRDEHGKIRDWMIRDVNEEALREIGLPPERLVNQLATRLVKARTPMIPNIELFHEVTVTGKGCQFELHLPWNKKHFLMSIFPVGSQILITTAMDITERKRNEEELQQLNRILKTLSSINQALMSATDETAFLQEVCKIITQECGHTMVWIGFAEEDEGKSVRPIAYVGFEQSYMETLKITWADTERGQGPTGTAIRTGKVCICRNMLTDSNFLPWRYQAIRRGYASSVALPLISGGTAFGVLTIYSKKQDSFSDEELKLLVKLASNLSQGIIAIRLSTAKAKAEKALRESEEKMRAIYEQAGVGINRVELDGRYIEANNKFYEMTGYSKKEISNLTIRDSYHPDDCQREEEWMAKLMAGEISTYTDVMRLIRKDGTILWINLTASLVRNGGEPAYFIIIVKDFSERKLMEQELQAKQEELFIMNEELQAQQEELTSANEELQTQQEELISANEELQAQQEELVAVNQELQMQSEILNSAFRELQRQSAKIREHAEAEARARDLAERRAAELDATISSIAAGIIIYDDLGNIFRMNEFARNLLSYPDDHCEVPYQNLKTGFDLYKSDGIPYVPEETPLYRALQGEIIRDEELMITKTLNQPIWLSGTLAPIRNYSQAIIGVIFVFTDITERKRKTEDLLASERELLKVTLNSLGEGVVATDPEERIILINQAAVHLTGYSENEVIGEPFHKVLYVLDDKTSEPVMITASPKMPYHSKVAGNLILVTRDLREVPIAMNSSPIKAADGRIIGTVTIFQDISEKQKTDRELLKADKLESLGILAGGIAHDFNNILAAILSNIQLALRKLEKNEDIKKYLLNTVETTRKASDLTKQLLTFSRGGAPVKKDASLVELIKDTAEFVLRGAKSKAEFGIPDDLWVASIDEGQISQVIHNLVLNAKQAMLKGGVINISAQNVTIGEDTRFKPGDYVKIAVKDQGIGIAKEHLSKIFDPYFTTKKDGNGLGLATSYSIISQHNGYLEVESQENAGTTFFIYLPASNTPVVPAASENEIAANGTGFKILFMDDEEKILQAVGEMLTDCFGYQVVLSTDGAGTIELYKQARDSGEPFDAVIMDLTVPGGMGGQETIAHLRDIDPKIKAIVSSGYANDPIISDYERYGFVGVVRKPYKIDELHEVLYTVIGTSH